MKLTFEINTKDEAEQAIDLLCAYVTKIPEVKKQEVKKQEVKKQEVKKQEVKKQEQEQEEEEEEEIKDWTQKQITDLAKKKVEELGGREEVKKVISNYASKISEVDEADYPALAKDLKALGN